MEENRKLDLSIDIEEFFDWFEHLGIEEMVNLVAEDENLRGYLGYTCAHDYAHRLDDPKLPKPIFDCFREWNWQLAEKYVEEADRNTIGIWTPKIAHALCWFLKQPVSVEARKKEREAIEKLQKEKEDSEWAERLTRFYERVPKLFKNASVRDFTGPWKAVVDKAISGTSMILYGKNGIGKTRFGWAVGMHFLQERKYCFFQTFQELNDGINKWVTQRGISATDAINEVLMKNLPVLIIDEADKVEMQGVPFRNFSYLINRRYEEQLQTILLCNANDMEELKTKFGGSIIDRFRSNTWPAEILDLTAAKSHRGKETTA